MKIEYELFAHHYILMGDKYKAYSAAYPNASGEAMKIAARRLISNPDVRHYISNRLMVAQDRAIRQYHEEEQRLAEQEYATMLLKRSRLRAIIAGEVKMQKHYRTKDGIETIETELPAMVVIRAIEADTRLANDWYNRRSRQAHAPADDKPVEDKPFQPKYSYPINEYTELYYGPDYMAGLRAKMVRDNPRVAEEYRKQGLRVLDYIPTLEDYEKMKEEQMRKYDEWRQLKKFADEQLDESCYDTGEGGDAGEAPADDVQEPPAALQQFPRVAAEDKKNPGHIKTIQNSMFRRDGDAIPPGQCKDIDIRTENDMSDTGSLPPPSP